MAESLKKLNVNIDMLADAMSIDDPFAHYLDVETGELVVTARDGQEEFESDAVLIAERERVFAAPKGRYVAIPRNDDSREAYRLMERFTETVDDVDDRDEILRALTGKGAFRRFKDTVYRLKLRDQWTAFEAEAQLEDAREWLETLGFEAPPSTRKRAAPLPSPIAPQPTIELLDVVLLGAPDGKTELVDGRVRRTLRAKNRDEARSLFKAIARSICAYVGDPWRKSMVTGETTRFVRDVFTLTVDGERIDLEIAVERSMWDRFRGG